MQNQVTYSCTALTATGKKGIIVPDKDGYYTLPIGALNVYNSANAFYPAGPGKQLLDESSSFIRRIKAACLKGEYGHPKRLPGWTDDDFAARCLTIEEKSVSHHFQNVWLEEGTMVDAQGRPIIAIMGSVCPSGFYGDALKRSFENPKEDVCFSVRSFTDDVRLGGMVKKNLVEIVTWDYVTEPGIAVARKYCAPGLESFHEIENKVFTRDNILNAVKKPQVVGLGMESHRMNGEALCKSLGWNFSRGENPAFLNW